MSSYQWNGRQGRNCCSAEGSKRPSASQQSTEDFFHPRILAHWVEARFRWRIRPVLCCGIYVSFDPSPINNPHEFRTSHTPPPFGSDETATLDIRNATRVMEVKSDGTPSYMMTYNLTSLKPLSTYYFRVRAANRKGFSEFSPNIVANTNDVNEDTSMVWPSHIQFDITSNIIEVEPRVPREGCAMLYISGDGDTYRAAHCFPADQVITDLPRDARSYRVRFCSRTNSLRCSQLSPVLGKHFAL